MIPHASRHSGKGLGGSGNVGNGVGILPGGGIGVCTGPSPGGVGTGIGTGVGPSPKEQVGHFPDGSGLEIGLFSGNAHIAPP